jgi:hypothetical protein
VESVRPARILLRVIDSSLNVVERDRAVQEFWRALPQYDMSPGERITPLRKPPEGDTLYGLDIRLPEPERVEIWLQCISACLEDLGVSDLLPVDHVTIRLTCTIEHVTTQVETASGEVVLSLLPAVNILLPEQQLFQARAALYAQHEGEFSPIEEENLELLRNQLQLDEETAEQIKIRALGPYQDRQTKLERYRALLSHELDRQMPLSAHTQTELARFCEAIGLAANDEAIATISIEEIAKRQSSEDVTDSESEEADDRPQQQPESPSPQQLLAMQQQRAEAYRQEFAGAITRSPYPSEFDRGRLEQARRNWQLDREIVRAIEREATDERYGPIDSALGLDYTRLRQLLWLNHWEAADQETERLLLSALSHDMRPLSADTLLSLSQYCVDVRTIDQLWARYSQNKFGFAAQQRIYADRDRQPGEFLTAVEWIESVGIGNVSLLVRRKAYRHLQFHLQAPPGHLPTWRWAANSLEGDYVVSEDIIPQIFHDVIEHCLPHLKKSSSPPPPSAGGDEPS